MQISLHTVLVTMSQAKISLAIILIMLVILLQVVTTRETKVPAYLSLIAFAFFAFQKVFKV